MLENLQEDNPINIMKGYTVTDKADGERSILYVADDKKVLRIKMSKEVSWTGLRVKKKEDIGTVLDGEYLEALRVFKIFDILQWRGESVMRVPLYSEEETSPSRLGYCERFVTSVDLEPELGYPVPTIETKTFIFAEGVKIFEAAAQILDTPQPYERDGLIFTPAHLGYGDAKMKGQRWSKLLKWKPPHMNTIDFLLTIPDKEKAEKGIFNGKPYVMGTLSVGYNGEKYIHPSLQLTGEYRPPAMHDRDYIKTLFSPNDPYKPDAYQIRLYLEEDGHSYTVEPKTRLQTGMIIECSYDVPNSEWVPLRVHKDKTDRLRAGQKMFGNEFEAASNIWKSIHEPVTEDMIRTGRDIPKVEGYYAEGSRGSRELDAMKFFHRSVKGMLYKNYLKKGQELLELACGRAGDLNRWIASGAGLVVGLDVDLKGLENNTDGACTRVLEAMEKGSHVPQTLFVHADCGKDLFDPDQSGLSDRSVDYLKLLNGLPVIRTTQYLSQFDNNFKEGFDCISVQFAIHYFFKNEETLDTFLNNVEKLVKPGGYFFGTVLDGASVFGELQKSSSIRIETRGTLNAEIRKSYDSEAAWTGDVSNLGMPIEVFMDSFTKGQMEYLVPFELLVGKLKHRGFVLESSAMFGDIHIDAQNNVPLDHQKISFLHRTFVFKKAPPVVTEVAAKPIKRVLKKSKKSATAEEAAEEKAEAAEKPEEAPKPKTKRKVLSKKAASAASVEKT
jgi:SAM-dependent methyltransferase